MTHKWNTRGAMLGGIGGGFGGAIFGSVGWLVQNSAASQDWIVMASVIILAIIHFIVCIKICFAKPTKQWVVAQWAIAALGVLHFAVVNLRWERWSESHLLSPGETLMKTNLTIGAVIAAFIVIFFIFSKTFTKRLVEYELRQMQIKDL